MGDHRKEERKNLLAFTPVFGLRPKTLLGYVEDLTTRGAKVIGEKPVETDKHMTLLIEFPGDVPESTTPRIMIPARVAWCKKENHTHYFDIGFEFTEVKPEDTKNIEAILKRYEFHRQVPATDVE